MPTDRSLITLADVVHRAAAVVDPDGADAAVAELVERHGDDDEPVRAILDELEERLAWGADEDPPIVMRRPSCSTSRTASTSSRTTRPSCCGWRPAPSSTARRPRRSRRGSRSVASSRGRRGAAALG
jgi:hypothetical protein